MKTVVSVIMILGLLAAAPAFAEKPAGPGGGKSSEQQIQHRVNEGQGQMNQEQHRVKEQKAVGKETGKGPEQGKAAGEEKGKKWWKFWE